MQSPSPPANIIDAIVIGLVQVLAPGFEALAQLIFATLIAGPALATMLLLWFETRIQAIGKQKVANGVAAVLLTFLTGYAFAWTAASLSGALDAPSGFYQLVLPVALGLAGVALLLQWFARKSFSAVRATGVACAIFTPLTLVSLDAMF
jgi:hypothetical protein